ncbi:hypothetical protein FSARC_14574 [Fusarium sarcochroum]|uniref:LysM domain-containing protein n=1 Tax=Fusarium sarcochroum TaxID=1208366 RepID=A0A8H4SS78_9HYPO|nr:hypothetical protein FSARC_14574 [Fusarium sarcochroum]
MLMNGLLLLAGGTQLALSAVIGDRLEHRDVSPKNPHDSKATADCTWWHDYDEQVSCDTILEENLISLVTFRRWNPSITKDCGGLKIGQSYCVEAAFEDLPDEPEDPEDPKATEKPDAPSPTKPSNGIKTPDPVQPGIVSNCDKFYMVEKNEGCAQVASKNDITLAQFQKWNTKVGSNCGGLFADTWACVSIIGHEATTPTEPTKPTNGIETPSPIQAKMITSCNKFHKIVSKTTCQSIENYYKVPLADFYKWNPAVGTACQSLLIDYHVCVGVENDKSTPTDPGNGIETPSPIQAKMDKNCNKFHKIATTTTCQSINSYYGLPLADFYKWNPSVGKNCESLLAGYWVCISVIGYKPTPTDPGNGISTPSPIQSGMVKNCNKFHPIKSTTTCQSIQDYYKITMAQLSTWNPAIGSKCTSLWKDYNVCVGVIGQTPAKPTPTTPSNGIKTPTPIQAGLISNCKKFHEVQTTTTCSSIQNYYKITMAQIAKWNPAVGSTCNALWAHYWVCVGV